MTIGHYVLAASHPATLLDGYPLGANGDRVFCQDCRRELRAGHRATVLAYRVTETNQWDVPVVSCQICSPTQIDDPTPGAVEILAVGVLTAGAPIDDGDGRLHLSDVDVLAYSGPESAAD